MSLNYPKENPANATLLERQCLNLSPAEPRTYHLRLSLPKDFHYVPGDCVGIYAKNSPQVVEKTLKALGAQGNESLPHPKSGERFALKVLLEEHLNLAQPGKKFLKALYEEQPSEALKALIDDREQFQAFSQSHHIWDSLMTLNVQPNLERFVASLPPLLPRLYSIASSQEVVGSAVDLCVAYVHYQDEHERVGVCSDYLCNELQKGDALSLYYHPTQTFTLPENTKTPLIMVGPGTGVAPFRGFMQQRCLSEASQLGSHWLFFGERHEKTDYFYQEQWQAWEKQGLLKISCAFSRDQAHKIYVQDRLREEGKLLFEKLEEGAIFYVCGDAKNMAKDVDQALHEIIAKQAGLDPEGAKAYVKALKAQGRYLRDVY